ncbi:subtilisin-like protease sbt3.18 [Quercus suber]|uniref:Subtilisin-like protease sbt3.18 n=1 Tax=Quercus suber TaxID=58331 RepID=A0AAW0M671_QUESU
MYKDGRATQQRWAPLTRLGVYKCTCSDIHKAYGDAIDDGVKIITMSLGPSGPPQNYLEDCFSIGALNAFINEVFVSASASAGNVGAAGSVVNAAPWVLTVAASTINRESFC